MKSQDREHEESRYEQQPRHSYRRAVHAWAAAGVVVTEAADAVAAWTSLNLE